VKGKQWELYPSIDFTNLAAQGALQRVEKTTCVLALPVVECAVGYALFTANLSNSYSDLSFFENSQYFHFVKF